MSTIPGCRLPGSARDFESLSVNGQTEEKGRTSRYSQRRDLSRRVRSNERPKDKLEIQSRRLHAARELPSWLTFDIRRNRLWKQELPMIKEVTG